jgi:hypothetical protein
MMLPNGQCSLTGETMADEAYAGEDHGLKAKLAELTAGARDMAYGALKEAMAWTVYQWTVLALLTAIFVLVALSYGGIRTELAALKQQNAALADGLAPIESQIGQQMSDLKSALTHRPRRQDRQDGGQDRRSPGAEARRARAQAGGKAEAAIGWCFHASGACAGGPKAALRARAAPADRPGSRQSRG